MAVKTIHKATYRDLVADLRELREAAGKSQSEVAHELGWPQQRLSAIEAGARRLDIIEFVALAKALRLSSTAAIRMIWSE